MPSRVIRDGLLDSPSWHGVSYEARCLYIALILLADDFGLINLQPIYIGRHAFAKRPSDARLDKLLADLVSVDLLRIYFGGDINSPVRFGFLPRFRQKMRQMKARHPMPPPSLYEDDLDAQAKFMEFKDLFIKMSAGRLHPVDSLTAEVKGSEGKGLRSDLESDSERKGKEVPLPLVAGAPAGAGARSSSFLQNLNPNLTAHPTPSTGKRNGNPAPDASPLEKAHRMGLTQRDDEGPSAFIKRVEERWPLFLKTTDNAHIKDIA